MDVDNYTMKSSLCDTEGPQKTVAKRAPPKCSLCGDEGHRKTTCPINKADPVDDYTEELLIEQYKEHKAYTLSRMKAKEKCPKIRLPNIPNDISENMIKFIIQNKLDDKTTTWNCDSGDLFSKKEGKQECKCFTSHGPCSFTPSSNWDVIYFLDCIDWIENNIILWRVPLSKDSSEWKNISVNKNQTFEDQAKQGRRPRISWLNLNSQILEHCSKIYEGTFENIFTADKAMEPVD